MTGKREDIQSKVNDMYKEVLGRHADAEGLSAATTNIMNGALSIEGLKSSLMNSDEYKRRYSYKQFAEEYKDRVLDKAIHDVFVDPVNKRLF